MAKVVIDVFDDAEDARNVIHGLESAGFSTNDISYVSTHDIMPMPLAEAGETTEKDGGAGATRLTLPGIGEALAGGPIATMLGNDGGLIKALQDDGVPDRQAHHYAESIRRGSILVMVQTSDEEAETAADVMSRHGAIDVDRRASRWQQSENYAGFNEQATPLSQEERARERATNVEHYERGERVLPILEEQLRIGKREVERGAIRIYTRVVSRPVEEQVRLREEHVAVKRRPVDRPVQGAEWDSFREGSIEVTEKGEEPVIAKQARVVEEVVVGKETRERVETVRETVRKTEVEVEEIGKEGRQEDKSFDANAGEYRKFYDSALGTTGRPYDDYVPGYRYGHEVAGDPRYKGRKWEEIEPEARKDWEARKTGSKWEDMKAAIRHSWDKVTSRTKKE